MRLRRLAAVETKPRRSLREGRLGRSHGAAANARVVSSAVFARPLLNSIIYSSAAASWISGYVEPLFGPVDARLTRGRMARHANHRKRDFFVHHASWEGVPAANVAHAQMRPSKRTTTMAKPTVAAKIPVATPARLTEIGGRVEAVCGPTPSAPIRWLTKNSRSLCW